MVKIVLCWCFGYEISNNNSLLTHVGRLAAIPGDRGVNGIVSVFFNVQSAYKYHKLWGGGNPILYHRQSDTYCIITWASCSEWS